VSCYSMTWTNFVCLSRRTHAGLQRFFVGPPLMFALCFAKMTTPFHKLIDSVAGALKSYALHTEHHFPREFLRRTVSSSCYLARVEV